MMQNQYTKIWEKIKGMNFDKKITLFLVTVVFLTALIILAVTSISTGNAIKSKSSALAMQRIESVTNTLELTLNDFNNIASYSISDNRVQNFLKAPNENKDDTNLYNNANNLLTYIINSNSYIDYFCILKLHDNTLLYQGTTWKIPDFRQKALDDFEKSKSLENCNLRVSLTPNFFFNDQYSLNLYQPVYDMYSLSNEIGLLTISINQEKLRRIYSVDDEDIPFDIYLTDAQGVILSHNDTSLIGTKCYFVDKLNGKQGSFEQNNNLVVYDHINSWNWYIVGNMPMDYLLKDTRLTVNILLVLLIIICIVSMFICLRISSSLYKPLGDLVQSMSIVSKGELHTRMNKKYNGEDIIKIVHGFNNMLEKIEVLMVQVKEEQHQIEQIKLNALQSQIKPHFLYNTLDCIHWQAAVDGNKNVSTMVKALATYYRLCLSKGKDIISLSEEIAHVKSYLIIQNMRYDNIVESNFEIDEHFNSVQIPKMTLQPLVENSIYHGIKIKDGLKGKITIRAYERYSVIIISISDSGTGMTQDRIDEINNSISLYDEAFGYGIRNVHKRIEILFGKGYGLFYLKNETGGITVEIRLPKDSEEV